MQVQFWFFLVWFRFLTLYQNSGPLADHITVASLVFLSKIQATWKCITFENDKWLQQSFAHAAG